MDPVSDGKAPPELGDLLDKVFATNEMGPCCMCEGRMKVAAKEEILLQSVGLELSNSSDDAWPEAVVPIETAESSTTLSILRQVLECFSPRLDGQASNVRHTVEVASESVKMILGEASLDLMMDKMGHLDECGKVDVAVALLLKAMLQRAEVTAKNDEAEPAQDDVQQRSMVHSLKAMRDEAQRRVASTPAQVHEHAQTEETRLGTLPNTIFVYLMRYAHDGGDSSSRKIKDHVDIPAEVDMAPYTAPSTTPEGQAPETVLYDLDGVIHHGGESTDYGHFQTFVRTGKEDWLFYDDDKVDKTAVGTVTNKNALMLAFTRRPPR